ncbi:MAG: EcsC family protein [Propionibacteriaceae bacterium]|jgi:hypothetical protein|nr:EcsC family protein [Propionibacteriaceae bacterium]
MTLIGTVARRVTGFVVDRAWTTLPQSAPAVHAALTRLIDWAIDGSARLSGAKEAAGKHLQRQGTVDAAIDAAIRQHAALITVQGAITNAGGLVSAIVGTPVNATGIIVLQTRMVACLAHLRGYDVDDPRVRTAIAMCLLGDDDLTTLVEAGQLPSTPLAVATSPVYDPALLATVTERVVNHILVASTGKGLVAGLARRIPVVGGGVGGIADLYDTLTVARCARYHLVTRRVTPVISSADKA